MWWKEIIGICATLFILVSMLFPTSSYKGSFWLRILNLVGSAIFVVYGVLLPTISTAVLNGCLIIINAYHFTKLVVNHKKSLKEDSQQEQLEKEKTE